MIFKEFGLWFLPFKIDFKTKFLMLMCRNPSFEFATKAKACKGASQEENKSKHANVTSKSFSPMCKYYTFTREQSPETLL